MQLSEAWSDDSNGADGACNVVIYDADTSEVLGDFHPDRCNTDGVACLPANGTYEGERTGSGWYLTNDGFTQQPPEG